jgi:hypothetical protein
MNCGAIREEDKRRWRVFNSMYLTFLHKKEVILTLQNTVRICTWLPQFL